MTKYDYRLVTISKIKYDKDKPDTDDEDDSDNIDKSIEVIE